MAETVKELLEQLRDPMKLAELSQTDDFASFLANKLLQEYNKHSEVANNLAIAIAHLIVGSTNGAAMTALANVMWTLATTAAPNGMKFIGVYISSNGQVYLRPEGK